MISTNHPFEVCRFITSKIEPEEIPINFIDDDDFLKIRTKTEQDSVSSLTRILRDGGVLPPVLLCRQSDSKFLEIDGTIRRLAHLHLDRDRISALILRGDRYEALHLRLFLNSIHHTPLSLQDRIINAQRLLREPYFWSRSDSEVGRICGLSNKTISKYRSEVTAELSWENPKSKLVVRSGVSYSMTTANINKKKEHCNDKIDLNREPNESANAPIDQPENFNEKIGKTNAKKRLINKVRRKIRQGHSDACYAVNAQKKHGVESGDVFVVKSRSVQDKFHIIYCGDSSNLDALIALFNNRQAGMLITDILYNVDYASGQRSEYTDDFLKIANDNLPEELSEKLFQLVFRNCAKFLENGSAVIIFHGYDQNEIIFRLYRTFFTKARQPIIWLKKGLRQNFSKFKWCHEIAAFALVGKHLRYWSGGNGQKTVLDEKLLGISQFELPRNAFPCKKPINVIRRLIEITVEKHATVLDPFGGSGTTLIAAEIAERIAVCIEIKPVFVALILERLSTGLGLEWEKTDLIGLPETLRRLRLLAETEAQND